MRPPRITTLGTFLVLLLLTSASAGAEISVEGTVLGPDGQGLAGATVEIRPVLRVYEESLRELEGRGAPEPVAFAVTSRGGWYELRVPGPGAWQISVSADGFVPMSLRPTVLIGGEVVRPARMERGSWLPVRVEDADGKPLSGARVAAARPDIAWAPARRAGVTEAGGTIRLLRREGETLRLSAIAPGHAIGRADGTGSLPVVLRLERGRAMHFEPVAGGKLVPGSVLRDQESALLIGRTGADGRLVANVPLQTSWDMQVETPDGRLAPFSSTPPPATLSEDIRVRRQLRIPPIAALTGRVIDLDTGRPIAGAVVWTAADPAAYQKTDASGVYPLSAWAEDVPGRLTAAALNHAHSTVDFVPGPGRDLADLALRQAVPLVGTVADLDGQPIEQAEVDVRLIPASVDRNLLGYPDYLETLSAEQLLEVDFAKAAAGRTRTSPAGRFRFPQLPPRYTYEVMARHAGLAPALAKVAPALDETQGTPELRLVLGPGRAARGRIVDESGEPVGGAQVELLRNRASMLAGDNSPDDGLYLATADEEGHFEILGLPEGWFDLRARRQGFLPHELEAVEVAGEVDFGMLVLSRGEPLKGRVTGPDGQPVEGLSVRVAELPFNLRSRVLAPPTGLTDAEGRFELTGVRGVSNLGVSLDLCRPGFSPLRVEVTADSLQPLEILLSPPSRIFGRVVGPDGKPVQGAAVSISPSPLPYPDSACPEGDGRTVLTDAAGQLTMEGLEAGRHTLRVEAPGYLPSDPWIWQVEAGSSEVIPTIHLKSRVIASSRRRDDPCQSFPALLSSAP